MTNAVGESHPALVPLSLPEDFAALPSEERSRLLAAGAEMMQYIYRRAAAVCIGVPPPKGKALRNGTAFLIEHAGQRLLGTAWHVVAYWLKLQRRLPRLTFQVGDALLNPRQALLWKDEAADIAILRLEPEQAAAIPTTVCEATRGCPPPRLKPGQYVLISGYPAVFRRRTATGEIEFNSLSTILQVTVAHEAYVVCQFLRENWVSYGNKGVPAPGTDLGGISGAPVLLVGNLDYPLVAAVSEFSHDFELLYLKPLTGIPLDIL